MSSNGRDKHDSYILLEIELPSDNYEDGDLIDGGRFRVESDSMGQVKVPAERLWGSQTQRSLKHFSIGDDRMPVAVYHAYGYLKKAAAIVNQNSGSLTKDKADLIVKAADEVIAGKLDDEFPLFVWQTGSGIQPNMNVNEVSSNRAIQLAGGKLGTKNPVHPNDDVNMSQSSNDTFPSAMHIATVLEFSEHLIPKVKDLIGAINKKALEWVDVVKIGRTLPTLKEALAYEGVSVVTCLVDYSENIRLTDRLGELTDPI